MPMEHWHSFWMGGMWVFPLLMILLILVSVFVLARVLLGRDGSGPSVQDQYRRAPQLDESPLEIAKRRYARGEITKEEFEEIRKTIG